MRLLLLAVLLLLGSSGSATAQVPQPGEVRQLVSFTFQPGRMSEAVALYRDEVLPLYAADSTLRSLRFFREAESPVPLDLLVVRAFDGMAGMDQSGQVLRAIADDAGTSVGALYGRIAAMSTGHIDEFVEMLPALGTGDGTSQRLTALVRYQLVAGEADAFEAHLRDRLVPWETQAGIASSTGRYLLGDGWHYLRLLAFDSLGAYEAYWSDSPHAEAAASIAHRRDQLVVTLPAFSLR